MFINVEPFWQFIAVGAVIIVSVLVDQTQRRSDGRATRLSDAPILSVRNVSKALRRRAGAERRVVRRPSRARSWRSPATTAPANRRSSRRSPACSATTHGEILLGGEPIHFATPQEARESGIETIYQDLALADNLSIGENIFLGREPKRRLFGLLPILDRAQDGRGRARRRWRASISTSTRLDAPVAAFSGGQRQAIAIGRALYWNARLVIMDEPTAALGVPEQRRVLALIQSLRAQGKGIIFISHNLRDIFEVADEIVVLPPRRERGRAQAVRNDA